MFRYPILLCLFSLSILTIYTEHDTIHCLNTPGAVNLQIFVKVKTLNKSLFTVGKRKGKNCYELAFLFALSVDVVSNPGPIQTDQYLEENSMVFPWGMCHNPVTWICKGVQCDMWTSWFHSICQKIDNSLNDRLWDSCDWIGVWKCSLCENINVALSFIPSLDSLNYLKFKSLWTSKYI